MKPVEDLQETKEEKQVKKEKKTGKKSLKASKEVLEKVKRQQPVKSKQKQIVSSHKGGFQTPLILSKSLGDVLGVSSESRTQVVSLMWKYIKEHDLQNPKDKREILLDQKLENVFGVKS